MDERQKALSGEREAAEQRLAEELGFSAGTVRLIQDETFESFNAVIMRKLWNKLLALSVENARLKEALQEVRSDIARAHTNNVIWPNTIRMLEEIACQK